MDRLTDCKTCSSSGVKPGTTPSTCPQCSGAGQVVSAVRTPLGMFQQVSTCPRCNGAGQTSVACEACGGDGRTREFKKISLRIPAGVDSGSRLRVRGEGNAGKRGGASGDLYVFINVKEHPTLRREGARAPARPSPAPPRPRPLSSPSLPASARLVPASSQPTHLSHPPSYPPLLTLPVL